MSTISCRHRANTRLHLCFFSTEVPRAQPAAWGKYDSKAVDCWNSCEHKEKVASAGVVQLGAITFVRRMGPVS